MSNSLIASLRKRLPSIYGEHLPDDIRYRDADGHDVVVALDAATVDELAFAIQTANAGKARRHADSTRVGVAPPSMRGAAMTAKMKANVSAFPGMWRLKSTIECAR